MLWTVEPLRVRPTPSQLSFPLLLKLNQCNPTPLMARHRTVPLEFWQKIVDAVLRGESISGVARHFEFPYSMVYSIWERYEQFGDINAGQRGGAQRQTCLNNEHIDFLIGLIVQQPGAMLEELQSSLSQRFPDLGTVALSMLHKALEDRAHMMLKRLSVEHDRHNSKETKLARQEYACRFHLQGESYSEVVFFDKAGFNLSLTRSQGCARVGQ